MKKTLLATLILAVAVLLTVNVGLLFAPEKKEEAKDISVTGEVVDLKCLVGMNMKGAGHKDCAMSCAKGGHALAILEGEGEKEMIYIPIGQVGDKSVNTLLVEHAGSKVTIEGKVVKKGGSTFLVAKSLKKAM
jgi:hypothetical protein